ncbi:MAG TPA: phosphotransferase [Legionella sp.]|nr:phosphotransferase [Legionella sp.]
MQTRETALNEWLKALLGKTAFTITPLAGDASFRRYFRLHTDGLTRVIMDAPPDKEAIGPFVQMGRLLAEHGVHTPTIHTVDNKQGFVLLEDLGDALLLNVLSSKHADKYYTLAMKTLLDIQRIPAAVPAFDTPFMLNELSLFREWFLEAYLGIELSTDETTLLTSTFDGLTTHISNQPQVLIHRDYHSRNLMVTGDTLGVIDFQDAMNGPYTYDLVSLLKDCYIQWPREKIMQWTAYFHQHLPPGNRNTLEAFNRGFDFCGLQRHLKVLGVFCRLYLRDNKPGYLGDLPLTFNYVMSCLETYDELQPLYRFMQNTVQKPFLQKVNR